MPLWRAKGDTPENFEAIDERVSQVEQTPHANISLVTLLATDYLNHFVEIIMLIELLPEMWDLADECRAWQPLTYKEHFERSRIADRDLALDAYALVPARYRVPFETKSSELHILILDRLSKILTALDDGDEAAVAKRCKEAAKCLNSRLQELNSIIRGGEFVLAQKEIDKVVRKSTRR
jgi:hypothetical protein